MFEKQRRTMGAPRPASSPGICTALTLALFLCAEAIALEGALPCNCAAPSLSLLEKGGKPRDCRCINGEKTYPTTPRDELMGMGPVALRRKKQKLEADQKKLEKQNEEQLKSNKEMRNEATASLEKDEDAYQEMVTEHRDRRADTTADHKKARAKATKLTDDLRLAKNKAREKKNEFTKLTSELQGAMLKMATCECKEAAASSALLERGKSRSDPQEVQMQEMVREVEALETKNLDLTDALKADASETARTLSKVDDAKNSLRIREKEAHSLDNKISKDKMLAAAEAQVEILQDAVSAEEAHTKSVDERCQKLETKLKKLKDELSSCGCA